MTHAAWVTEGRPEVRERGVVVSGDEEDRAAGSQPVGEGGQCGWRRHSWWRRGKDLTVAGRDVEDLGRRPKEAPISTWRPGSKPMFSISVLVAKMEKLIHAIFWSKLQALWNSCSIMYARGKQLCLAFGGEWCLTRALKEEEIAELQYYWLLVTW